MLSVKILVSIPDSRSFDACTLVFDTLRVGFPTAKIHVDINAMGSATLNQRALEKANKAECFVRWLPNKVHHAEWIRNAVEGHIMPWPLVILDADTIFWKSVEDWEFPPETLLAGYYVPEMWNDFAKCVSAPRIHTSFMWMPNTGALLNRLRAAYPLAYSKAGEYCPCDPFMPAVRFLHGRGWFWDSCANLYEMLTLSGDLMEVFHFGELHKACFDHLNSASFYDVMMERMDNNRGFALAHNEFVKKPELLRNLWPVVDSYYAQKHIEGRLAKGV